MSDKQSRETIQKDYENLFQSVRILDSNKLFTIDETTKTFIKLATIIEKNVPAGREKSLVITKLQEAKMWAIEGICKNKEDK